MDWYIFILIVIWTFFIAMTIYTITRSIIIFSILSSFILIFTFFTIFNGGFIDDTIEISYEVSNTNLDSLVSSYSNNSLEWNTSIDIKAYENNYINRIIINPVNIDIYKYNQSINSYIKSQTQNDIYNHLNIKIIENNTVYYKTNFSNKTIYIDDTICPNLFPIKNNTIIDLYYNFSLHNDLNSNEYIYYFSYPKNIIKYENIEINEGFSLEDLEIEPIFFIIPLIICISSGILMCYNAYRNKKRQKYYSQMRSSKRFKHHSLPSSDLIKQYVEQQKELEKLKQKSNKNSIKISKYGKIPENYGDYTLLKMTTVDKSIEIAREYRDNDYWVKIKNFSKSNIDDFKNKRCCGVYISKWTKDEEDANGKPKWEKK